MSQPVAKKLSIKKSLIYFYIVFNCAIVFSKPVDFIEIKTETKEFDLSKALFLYKDDTRRYSYEDLWKKPQLFKPLDPYHLQLGYSQTNAWIKLKMHCSALKSEELFFVVRNPSINELDVFLLDKNGKCIKYLKTGLDKPFNMREIDLPYYVFYFVATPNQDYTILAKMHNRQGNLSSTLELLNARNFRRFQLNEQAHAVFFFIFFLIAFLVSLTLVLIFRETVYSYYCAFIFCVSLHLFCIEGYAYQFFFPDSPSVANMSRAIFIIPSFVFFILFFIQFLSQPHFKPNWVKKILQFQIGIYLLLFCTAFIPKPDIVTQATVVLMNLNIFAGLGLMIYAAIFSLKERFKPSYFILLAILPNLLLGVLSILRNFGFIHTNKSLMMYGVSIEFVLLFAALLSRFKMQLAQNDSLKKKINHYHHIFENANKNSIADTPQKEVRFASAKFSASEIESNYNSLIALVKADKVYLDRELSLNSLAARLNISSHLLSHIINQRENKNFTEFINYYRVLESQRLLQDPRFLNYSIEGIGYESGFNTRTTFYSAFKKETSKTPVAFRNEATGS